MRARSVNEAIGFKRGINPKDAMVIGAMNIAKEKWAEMSKNKWVNEKDLIAADITLEQLEIIDPDYFVKNLINFGLSNEFKNDNLLQKAYDMGLYPTKWNIDNLMYAINKNKTSETEVGMKLVRRAYDKKEIKEKEIKGLARKLPYSFLAEYFPEHFDTDKIPLNKRSPEVLAKDYIAATKIIKKHPDVYVSTTKNQVRRGTLQLSTVATMSGERHNNQSIKYVMRKSGYIGKDRPSGFQQGFQQGLFHNDLMTTYVEMVHISLKGVAKDIKKGAIY